MNKALVKKTNIENWLLELVHLYLFKFEYGKELIVFTITFGASNNSWELCSPLPTT